MLISLQSLSNLHEQKPNKVLFKEFSKSITIKNFVKLVEAYRLQHCNTKKNIGLFGDNNINYAAADCGLSLTENTLVPIPRFFKDDLIKKIISDAQLDYIYTDDKNFSRIGNLFKNTLNYLQPAQTPFIPVQSGIHKRVIYTSGTTGTPKGVIQTERQINFIIKNLSQTLSVYESDRYLSILPIATLLEQIASIHCVIFNGAETTFNPDFSRDVFIKPQNIFSHINTYKPSITCFTPLLLENFINQLDQNSDLSFLKAITVGGSKTPKPILIAADRLNLPVYEGYGLSETCSVVSLNCKNTKRLGSVGKPLPGIKVSIENDEVVVSSPSIMQGYYNCKSHIGKIYTGDIGSIDSDGFLYIHGRKDDVIALSNGRNIDPNWLETMISEKTKTSVFSFLNQQGQHCMVLAVQDQVSGQQLENQLKSILPDYAYPEKIYFRNPKEISKEFFLNTNGKVDRKKIAEILINQQ
ncbi:MAG: AMP-binding protein [Candidatus Fonsibacter sp.]